MLYHYASQDYLKRLHRLVSELLNGVVDPLLELARLQKRDLFLVDPQWGKRDTSENWSNNAWPFLKELQASLAKDIAGRALDRYRITGVNNSIRGIDEYSMRWASLDEEKKFKDMVRIISAYAYKIDDTLDDYSVSRWSDFGFAYNFKEFAEENPQISRFLVRTDVTGESGKSPGRTGVYVAQDDPNAALQFAWTGNGGGRLRPSKTFSQIGLDALHTVGRDDLWFNDQKMFEFITSKKYAATLAKNIYISGQEYPSLAPSAVARSAFSDRPCKWYFVEIQNGEFEDVEIPSTSLP